MITTLQGLRGLAILLVFFSHWFAGARSAGFLPAQGAQALAVLNFGKYGVELFFMISGFVIVKSLVRHAQARTFFIDRIARIYPVFLALHLFIFISGPLIHQKFFDGVGALDWAWLFTANLLLLPGVLDVPIAQIVAWSLSYEALFYGLAAAVFHGFRPKSVPWRWGGAIVVAVVFGWFHPRAFFFLPGALAYFCWRSEPVLRRLSSEAAAVSLLVFLLSWRALVPEGGKTLVQMAGSDIGSAFCFLVALAAGLFFFVQVLHAQGWLKTVMASRWLVSLGEVSYSFYLLHVVVLFPLKRAIAGHLLPWLGASVSFVVFGMLAFSITYGLSVLSRRYLEVLAGEKLRAYLLSIWSK